MKKHHPKKSRQNQTLLFTLVSSLVMSTPTYALFGIGDVVFDPTNVAQSTITATEEVTQTLKQVEEYTTQLQQYQNQLQNTLAPAAYVWDQATGTMNKLRGSIDTLNYYKNKVGNLDSFLGKYQDVGFYRNSPCYSSRGCTAAERAELDANMTLFSEAQKKANDASLRGIDQQQDSMEADARQLERLQSGAQGAVGQMQAIQFANQLASAQGNQLLQIRGLLIAQQNAIATRNQALADREAQEAAASEQLRMGTFEKSPVVNW
jgi:type IV secretion system protein TrbJ